MFAMFDSFGTWLQEQHDRKGAVGDFARITWLSFTSGDCPYYSHALEWRDHYKKTLSDDKYERLIANLKIAFKTYAEEVLHLNDPVHVP